MIRMADPAWRVPPGDRPADGDPDSTLMLEIQAGNDDAFTVLSQRYRRRVIGMIEHLLGHRQWSDDLAQEVFLRVYRARHQYVAQGRFASWLMAITCNVVANARRARARRREVAWETTGDELAESRPAAGAESRPDRMAERAELCASVRRAIDQLPAKQGRAMLLHRLHGLEQRDIGRIMGLSPEAVKSLLARARRKMRGLLAAHAPGLRS